MHFYVRVIAQEENSPQYDMEQLSGLTQKLQIAKLTGPIEPHPRGGYCLFFDCPERERGNILEFLYTHGFRPCI